MKQNKLFAHLLILSLLASCDSMIDDQTIATEEQKKIVNPVASSRDFQGINNSHKVLVAIMDSGVDYNHPYLKSNIHFKLDENNKPVGTGWDFAGNDAWPAPYVARTNHFNPQLSDADREKGLDGLLAMQALLLEHPELKSFFPLERNSQEEDSEGFDHGTHVAGLASYDSPEIGIMSYRVTPMNIIPESQIKDNITVLEQFSSTLIAGLNKAINDGATVINMSLGVSVENTDEENKLNFFKKFNNDLTELVTSNPNIMFIVAAGNDGKWIDGTTILELPCFIPKKNVICVGALTEDMEPTYFTNIVKSDEVTTIFTWGNEILSTFPSNSCSSPDFSFESLKKGSVERAVFASIARQECSLTKKLKQMSGTSMASPIIARKVAKIRAEFPELDADGIKDKLFAKTTTSNFAGLTIWKLAVEKPSWYQNISNFQNKMLSNSNWNFFVLQN
jgi:subtilisin family serine protease